MDEPLLVTRKARPVSPLSVCGVVGICVAAAVCCAQLFALRAVAGRMEALEVALAASRAEVASTLAPAIVLAAASAVKSDQLPHKFVVDGLTPSADQAFRGDCWLFAVTGLLEDSYRRYGVKQGWMDPKDFLRLSRQALGISIMELCKKHPIGICPANLVDGKVIFGNTTEGTDGADEHLLYWLRTLGDGSNVFPDSVCPYAIHDNWRQEWTCDGLEAARKTNPLHFTVKSMKSYYEREAMKQALIRNGRPLSLGITMVTVPHFLPCIKALDCEPATAVCEPCPLERIYSDVDCCITVEKPMVTMKGEWFLFQDQVMELEGGHAINIVGWNDVYRTEHGDVGGFIVRNTWADGLGTAHGLKARGSHTAAFFMQDIGDIDESLSCPNPHSARSWAACESIASCTEGIMAIELGSVTPLNCIDLGLALPAGQCDKSLQYYMHNTTEWGTRGLFIGCFLSINNQTGESGEMCLPPATIDDMATIFSPPTEDLTLNIKELCGYNFVPYSVIEAMEVRFGGMATSQYDIEWAKESYPSMASHQYDYKLVKESTRALLVPNMSTPNVVEL